MDAQLQALSQQLGIALQARGAVLACAESCTGGWASEVVTATAGSSNWFDRGFVTYSNAAKQDMLGVRAETLVRHGAVSEATVGEMAAGALARSRANVALAISGIAGPDGGTPAKPVGMVCFAWACTGQAPRTATRRFQGDREAIRREAVIVALEGVLQTLAGAKPGPSGTI